MTFIGGSILDADGGSFLSACLQSIPKVSQGGIFWGNSTISFEVLLIYQLVMRSNWLSQCPLNG